MTFLSGTRLGPYEIIEPLGAGGMGEVYRARDSRLGRSVALKVLPDSFAADPGRLSRFEQEARSASALNHPNIVTVYEIGQFGSTPYIAMELVEGKTVKELVASGPVPPRKAIQLASQVADGLAKAHAAGIVHRDLKPDNIMISEDGFAKVLDFGLAKLVRPHGDDLSGAATAIGSATEVGVVLGTIGYMSPEQASGHSVDFRSDQFAVGTVLYELVTGARAFRKDTAASTLVAILQEEPEPIASVNPRVPAPLCWIIERCLAKDPNDRYASTRDLARDLAALRDRLSETPPDARAPRASNLPAPTTGFIGREREIAAASALLLRPEVRMLTLTGPGGIGKTRLALEVARAMTDHFPGGVCFVPLAPLPEAGLVASTISQALAVREGPHQSSLEALREHLQASVRAPILLLLDGFEHLTSAASIVADLISAGPHVKVLVTSRSPLHLYGEHEFPVPTLALPDPGKRVRPEGLLEYEAVALFLQRAVAIKPDFTLSEENAAAIAEICARLDGLPLAVELAAARVKLLSPSAIRTRLQSRLQLLTGGSRDLPARQQTLRGAIDWSHGLLNAAEQRLFRRLAVFVGGCTLEAAEAVSNAREDLGVDVLDGIQSMVDHSLLQQLDDNGGEPRFVMLETIREYALEQLASSGDEPVTRRAHAAYYLVLGEEESSAAGSEPMPWLERCETEHDNFRAALDYIVQAGEAEWGLRMGAALFQFWVTREHLAEGRDRLSRILALPKASGRTRARARALFAAGALAGEQSDYAAGQAILQEATEINRELGDRWGLAVCLNALAVHALDQGDGAAARALLEEALTVWRDLGDRAAVARCLSNLANAAKAERDYPRARALHEEALAIFSELGNTTGVAWELSSQGDVARQQGEFEAARVLYEKSLSLFRDGRDRAGMAGALADLGNLARDRAEYETARALYRESLTIFRELDQKRGIARLLECFASCAAAERQPERSLRLAGVAAALRETVGAPLSPGEQAKLEHTLQPSREALGDRKSASAWMEGWKTPLEKAVEAAFSWRPSEPVTPPSAAR
jgi:predicted ATPase